MDCKEFLEAHPICLFCFNAPSTRVKEVPAQGCITVCNKCDKKRIKLCQKCNCLHCTCGMEGRWWRFTENQLKLKPNCYLCGQKGVAITFVGATDFQPICQAHQEEYKREQEERVKKLEEELSGE